jgi:hypothetical protein
MLPFINVGRGEISILVAILLLSIAVGNYGRNTVFGYWGSILLSICANPVVAFVVIYVVKKKYHTT